LSQLKEGEEEEQEYGEGGQGATAVAEVLCAAPTVAVTILGVETNVWCGNQEAASKEVFICSPFLWRNELAVVRVKF